MCGILIWFSKKNTGVDINLFSRTLKFVSYRGPDSNNSLYFKGYENIKNLISSTNTKPDLAIGHNRLSLVDLSKNSDQPFFDENIHKYFLFNGEFFNFREIFPTFNSDGKALFELINKSGFNSLNNVKGMFSLAIVNLSPTKREITIARDSFGKKPLYYYLDKDSLVISSDFVSIHNIIPSTRILNKNAFGKFVSLKNSLDFKDKETIWKQIKSVIPGSYLNISLDNLEIKSENYFSSWRRKNKIINLSNQVYKFSIKQLSLDIQNCVEQRVSSDADLAVCISGGIDSSLIAYFANEYSKKNNKKIGFYTCILNPQNKLSEDLFYSRLLSEKLGVDLVEVDPFNGDLLIDSLAIVNAVKTIIKFTASPINLLNSTLTNYFLCEKVFKDGYKAILDGVGGDEIMGGYPNYSKLFLANMNKSGFKNSLGYLKNYIGYESKSKINNIYITFKILLKSLFCYLKKNGTNYKFDYISKKIYASLIEFQEHKDIIDGLKDGSYLLKERDELLSFDHYQEFEICKYQLPFYHQIMDITSMVNSIENRSPFLDQRLLKYIYMPDKFKHRNGLNKYALRQILKEKGLDFIASRKKKEGNTSPFPIKTFLGESIKKEIITSKYFLYLFGKDQLDKFTNDPYFNSRFLSFAILLK